jgi:hypothetical protein
MESDLEYFKIAERQTDRIIETLQILVDIERTRGENRLVVIGIILGSFIGFGQLLEGMDVHCRLILSIGIGSVLAGIYYAWTRRGEKHLWPWHGHA